MRPAHKFIRSIVVFVFSLVGVVSVHGQEEENSEFDPIELINGHVWDSHDFHILDWDGHAISMPLPIILWTDNGLTTFSSARFHHDNSAEVVVEENGHEFVRYKEHIFYADKFNKEKFDAMSTVGRPFMYEDRPLD